MLITPLPLGNMKLSREDLAKDCRSCIRTGPCGLGEKAVYLSSFFIDRRYYVTYPDVRRVFKRVAMSKGGFSGKGAFGSIPYLVVLLSDGTEHQCQFRFEEEVDRFLNHIRRYHPTIPTYSEEGERRMAEERAKEEARYVKELSPQASEALTELKAAKAFLEKDPDISDTLAYAAKQKRTIDRINPTYRYVAIAIFLLAVCACIFGIISLYRHEGGAVYFVLFGIAFIFYTMSSQVLPTGRNNRRYGEEQWQKAVAASKKYVEGYHPEGLPAGTHPSDDADPAVFPVPAQYAHPATIDRMIRVVREGRAQTVPEAWDVMKADLRAINSDVTVSQTEYDEIVTIKPMFLLCGYEDTLS